MIHIEICIKLLTNTSQNACLMCVCWKEHITTMGKKDMSIENLWMSLFFQVLRAVSWPNSDWYPECKVQHGCEFAKQAEILWFFENFEAQTSSAFLLHISECEWLIPSMLMSTARCFQIVVGKSNKKVSLFQGENFEIHAQYFHHAHFLQMFVCSTKMQLLVVLNRMKNMEMFSPGSIYVSYKRTRRWLWPKKRDYFKVALSK